MIGTTFLTAALLPLSLSVSVSGGSPFSVPPGAQRVPMTDVMFSASCSGDVTVRSITVAHSGMGDARDISSVYAWNDGRRILRGRALSSRDGMVSLSFRPALIVRACGTTTVTIMANFSSTAAATGEHALTVPSGADIDADGATVQFEATSTPVVRRTTGVAQGSVTAEFLPLLQRVTYGDHRTVARIRLTADGTYDQEVDAITLTNDGSARNGDLQNLTLETARGEVLARLPSLSGYRAPFVLTTPMGLERGAVKVLTVRADVRAGRRRTIDFTLEEPGDLVARRARSRR